MHMIHYVYAEFIISKCITTLGFIVHLIAGSCIRVYNIIANHPDCYFECYILHVCICFQSVTYLHFLWITPVQMVATMYLLWVQLGVSCFVPLALMILMILYQSRLGRVFAVLR